MKYCKHGGVSVLESIRSRNDDRPRTMYIVYKPKVKDVSISLQDKERKRDQTICTQLKCDTSEQNVKKVKQLKCTMILTQIKTHGIKPLHTRPMYETPTGSKLTVGAT